MVEASVARKIGFQAGLLGYRGMPLTDHDTFLPLGLNQESFVNSVKKEFYVYSDKISNLQPITETEALNYRRICNILGQLHRLQTK